MGWCVPYIPTDFVVKWSTWSNASAAKSRTMISMINLLPQSARPPAVPATAASLTGVLMTVPGYRAQSLLVTPNACRTVRHACAIPLFLDHHQERHLPQLCHVQGLAGLRCGRAEHASHGLTARHVQHTRDLLPGPALVTDRKKS
jgi:hypothetical protein